MSEQHEFAIRIRYADPNREGGWGPWLDGSGYNHLHRSRFPEQWADEL